MEKALKDRFGIDRAAPGQGHRLCLQNKSEYKSRKIWLHLAQR